MDQTEEAMYGVVPEKKQKFDLISYLWPFIKLSIANVP